MIVSTEEKHRFVLVEDALQFIKTAPVDQPPSVETLATALNTTRRTLLNAFQEKLGTSPSRYMLARRLNEMEYNETYSAAKAILSPALRLTMVSNISGGLRITTVPSSAKRPPQRSCVPGRIKGGSSDYFLTEIV